MRTVLPATVVVMSVLAVPPVSAQQHETLQGTLQVVIADNLTTPTSTTQYCLNTDQSSLQLILPDPSVVRGVASGSRVQVTGTRAGKQFIVDANEADNRIKIVATFHRPSRAVDGGVANTRTPPLHFDPGQPVL
jgi:hypothetical protein